MFFRRRPESPETALIRIRRELVAARADAEVIIEQLASLQGDADDLEVRAIVSENTADARDARHAKGHLDRHTQQLARVRERIAVLSAEEAVLVSRPLFDE